MLWFRNDLRITDNPALAAASVHDELLPVYIYDRENAGDWPAGGASRWWLHHSLDALASALKKRGSRLVIRRGPAKRILPELVRESGAGHVYWNRRYEPAEVASDTGIKQALGEGGVDVTTFNAGLLFEPWQVRRADGGPYKVFSAFWKTCLRSGLSSDVTPAPERLPRAPGLKGLAIDELGLLPEIRWDTGLGKSWQPGEAGALERVDGFLADAAAAYAGARDRPDLPGTSRLSPHLHFGEIGPRQVLSAIAARRADLDDAGRGIESFVRELGWREFAFHLLFRFPQTATEPLNPRFAGFPWRTDYVEDLRRWQRGLTGIPLVDAGMRELWHTGWMHNRVRMVAASFLTKNLLIPWQEGARWFWDTLVDADLASNTLGWQWVAGSGADAAPYFRVFNPVLQGEKFDPTGAYVRRWIPELEALESPLVHKPWSAPPDQQAALEDAGYPPPMIDLRTSRERALAAYRGLSG